MEGSHRTAYAEFKPDFFETYHKILQLARKSNTYVEPPEFVFIGQSGHGKTILVEAFLGHSITRNKPTKRPLYLNLVNNVDITGTPRVTIKRDPVLSGKGGEYERDFEVAVENLGAELQKRNVPSPIPIVVHYEHKMTMNLTLIDTPPMKPPKPVVPETSSEEGEGTPTPASGKSFEGGSSFSGTSSSSSPSTSSGVPLSSRSNTISTDKFSKEPSTPKGGASSPAGGPSDRRASMPPPVVSNSTSSAGSSPAGSSITSPASSSSAGTGAPGSSLSAGTAGSGVGKRSSSSRDAKLDEIEQAIMDLIKQQDRFLICVEHAGEHNEMEELLSKVDPRFERTIFVRTKWQEYLKTLTTTEAVNKFLGLLPYEQGKCFLTSLTSTGHSHSRFSKAESYQKILADAIKEDLNLMESLQYNKRYQAMVGIHAFREYLVNLVWKQYQERFPEVLENINTRKREAQEAVMANRERQANLEPYKLRARASNYVVAFLQNLEKLLKGTLEGIPQQNGQTLDDELSLEESGPWMDQMARTIELEHDWNIPYTENKLYGKQQFERLLSQFRAVCHHCDMGMVTLDEVACAGGPTKVATISNFAWAASDIAQRKSMKALLPLIRQLHEKAIYIMKRSLDIVDYMLISQGRRSALPPASSFDERSGIPRRKVTVGQENPASAIYEYPYFIQTVKEHFFKFVDEVVADCVDKCKDEFYCTRIIYWDMMNFNGHKFPEKHYEMDIMEKKDEVVALSRVLFKDIRARIVQNVLLKFHNFFFMPIQNGLWGAVQGKVTSMTDVELAELFQAEPNKVTLQERDKELQGEMKQLASLEGEFLEASANFSRPK